MALGPATRANFTVTNTGIGPTGTLFYSDAGPPFTFTATVTPSGDNLETARVNLVDERVTRVAALAAARLLVDRPAVDAAASQLQYLDRALAEIVRAQKIAAILEAVV